MWETIRGYLTFTRKERFGVLFLLLIIIVFFALPYIFPRHNGEADPQAYEKMKKGIGQFEMNQAQSSDTEFQKPDKQLTVVKSMHRLPADIRMFYFDPNLMHQAEWKKLGLSDRLSETISHYIERGGRFKQADDLKKLYGMHETDFNRLFPFVRITQPSPGHTSNTSWKPAAETLKKAKLYSPADVNDADSSQWCAFPGIGPKLAARIIHFRDKLGGFYCIEQVAETFGLADSVFQKIRPSLRCGEFKLVKIDVNHASQEILQQHPYIRWPIAREIIAYRLQHGNFVSVDQLLRLSQIDSVKWEKIKPYVTITP